MATYANQKTIVKGIETKKDAAHPYVKLSIDSVQDAMKELKGYEFQLYMLLYMNQKDFKLDFSPSYLEKTYGGTRKTWSAARKVLEEKGYLVANGNKDTFYERPMREDQPVLNSTDAEAMFRQVSDEKKWDF